MEPLRKDVQELIYLFFLAGHVGQMEYDEIPGHLIPALGAALDQGFIVRSDRAINMYCATNKAIGETGCCDSPQEAPPAEAEAQPKRKGGRPKKSETPGDTLIIGAIQAFYRDGRHNEPPLGKAIADAAGLSGNSVKEFLKKKFGEHGQEKFEAAWRRDAIGDKLAEWQD